MNGDPSHIIVSTAYAVGARDFDASKALLLMIKGATQPTQGYPERPGLEDYKKLGYVPREGADTLEYNSADFAIAQRGLMTRPVRRAGPMGTARRTTGWCRTTWPG
jgi:putative alpha-1,2-mannosidase